MEGARQIPWRGPSQGRSSQTEGETDQGSSQPPLFEYSQLPPDCIRLLSPDPESASPGHAWRLETVRLDEKPKFDALSYVWGSQATSHSILVNSRTYYVHTNLYSAMPYLATRRSLWPCQVPIWIDAICIDQKNKTEVAEQVALMHQIYRGAQVVWAWLGLSQVQADIPTAISLLDDINRAGRECSNGISYRWQHDENNMDSIVVNANARAAMSHLLANPWYYRVWVMQEAALARDLIFLCGEHEIRHETINAALQHVRLSKLIDEKTGSTVRIRGIWDATGLFKIRRTVQHPAEEWKHPSANDYTLLIASDSMVAKQAQCLLAEDRIWGLMGFSGSTSLEHELRKLLDTESLYIHFSRYVLSRNDPNQTSGSWWHWLELPFRTESSRTLPSWVPDFHKAASKDAAIQPISRHLSCIRTEGSKSRASWRRTRFSLGQRTNEILLLGKRLDEVKEVIDAVHSTIPSVGDIRTKEALQYLCRVADWVHMVDSCLDRWKRLQPESTVVHDLKHEDDWWQIMLFLRSSKDVEDFIQVRSGLEESKEIAAKYVDGRLTKPEYASTKALYRRKLAKELESFQKKQLFWTDRGRFGFTRQGVKPGDTICVFDGADIPHVLEKAEAFKDGKGRWRFVGDAFVDGLMHGQADDIDVEGEDFCIV